MGRLTLGYWNLRGRGAAARMMLEYGELDFEDKTYKTAEEWFGKDKQTLGFDFPNLPYLIDGDMRLTECWAIYRYIGRKIGLEPATEQARCAADMLEGVVNTLFLGLIETCYNPNFENVKPKMRERQETKLAAIEKFLRSGQYLTGPKLCFVDFVFYQSADHHRLMFPDIMDKFPKIKLYLERFEAEETIKAYMESDRYYVFPITAASAQWGGRK